MKNATRVLSCDDKNATRVLSCDDWLAGKARNDFSQFGEDGLIEAVFERIGTTNRWCFEVGAADGVFFSNTKRLRDDGWYAALIESNETSYAALKLMYDPPRVTTVCEKITPDNFDDILYAAGVPSAPDFGVIDIDGQDWWVWHDLFRCVPRVMLVEISTSGDTSPVPLAGGQGQAGALHIEQLGDQKGYDLVAKTYCNALFVQRGELENG
jgi:hypothetical protein